MSERKTWTEPYKENLNLSELQGQMLLSELRANTFRMDIAERGMNNESDFGFTYKMGQDFPGFVDHEHHHARHVEYTIKKSLIEYDKAYPGEFDLKDPDMLADMTALFLFPYTHDGFDQQTSSVRNAVFKEKGIPISLPVKKGHGVASGVMLMAQASRYAESCGITFEEAWNIISPAAIMTMRHDIPEKFEETFGDKSIPTEIQLTLEGEELIEPFEDDKLDLLTLSPKQYVEILRMQKYPYGFIGDFGEEGKSIYGLSPEFEAEFKDELSQLNASTSPLMENLSDSRRTRLKTLTEIAYFSDTADMISPWLYQFGRTFLTDYSRRRAWSIFNGKEQPTVDDAFGMIIEGPGFQPADDMRLLWELVHANGTDSKLNKIPWVIQFHKDHTILGAMLMVSLGERIMEIGELSEDDLNQAEIRLFLTMLKINEPDIADETANEIMASYGMYPEARPQTDYQTTPITKYQIPVGLEILWRIYHTRAKRLKQKIDTVGAGRDEAYNSLLREKYRNRCGHFVEEFRDIAESLSKKRKSYTDEDKEKYVSLVAKVVDHLFVKYEVTEDEAEEYCRILKAYENAASQPFVNESISTKPVKIL